MNYDYTLEKARQLDESDSLRQFRHHFHIPKDSDGNDLIYFCGNSLGLQPKGAREKILEVLDDWKTLAVDAHFDAKHPWMPYHEYVARSLAKIAGTMESEVVAMNSLTVNLHLLMISFYRPTSERHRIIIEGGAFPSDQYAVKSQIEHHGFDPKSSLIELQPRDGEFCLRTEDIVKAIEREAESLALVMLGGVNYLTGQAYDMETITKAGHSANAVVGYDLAHAAGNIPLQLHDWNADFAVWCTYKYLNASPGSIAGAFVHDRHADKDLHRFAGWWGHDKKTRFKMPPDFNPISGAEGWQLSNPPILALAALRASLDEFDNAGMENLREKSVRLTDYMEKTLKDADIPGLQIVTPTNAVDRGAQLSLQLRENGESVHEELSQRGVVSDWREPNVIRVAPVPLYNGFEDVFRFVEILKGIVDGG